MPESSIHSAAIVSPQAKIGQGVSIGPFCVVGPDVSIREGSVLRSHVVVDGHVEIGRGNQFFPFCSIGAPPQDVSYKGEATCVVIGEENTFQGVRLRPPCHDQRGRQNLGGKPVTFHVGGSFGP